MAYFYEKPEGLDWETWNFSWRHKRSVVKKHLKIIFSQCSPSLWKCNLKYENICLLNCSSPNIWAVVYIIVFNSSPPHTFYTFKLLPLSVLWNLSFTGHQEGASQQQSIWGGTIMCLVCMKSSRPSNIYWKWNCTQIFIQISCLK